MRSVRLDDQSSSSELLLATAAIAVGTVLANWLLLNVAAQLILALISGIALWILAGAIVGAEFCSAYDGKRRGAIIGIAIQFLTATVMLIWWVV